MQKPALLLVEDSEDDAFFFHRTFQKTGIGCSIHHVINGSAAIEFLRNAANSDSLPQIIFLDLKMPVLNGFDVLTWLQKQTFFPLISVIVLSGSDDQLDKERAQRLGARDYVVKPVTAADFNRLLVKTASDSGTPAPMGSGGLA